jgi:hypothetical protein
MVLCTMGFPRAERSHHMSVQRFLHTIDGISTWDPKSRVPSTAGGVVKNEQGDEVRA